MGKGHHTARLQLSAGAMMSRDMTVAREGTWRIWCGVQEHEPMRATYEVRAIQKLREIEALQLHAWLGMQLAGYELLGTFCPPLTVSSHTRNFVTFQCSQTLRFCVNARFAHVCPSFTFGCR